MKNKIKSKIKEMPTSQVIRTCEKSIKCISRENVKKAVKEAFSRYPKTIRALADK
jgi:lipoate-protein ligase A